jgi:hypothetical protein
LVDKKRAFEKEVRDLERNFEKTKKDWTVVWRDDERRTRDRDRNTDKAAKTLEREVKDGEKDVARLERDLEKKANDKEAKCVSSLLVCFSQGHFSFLPFSKKNNPPNILQRIYVKWLQGRPA